MTTADNLKRHKVAYLRKFQLNSWYMQSSSPASRNRASRLGEKQNVQHSKSNRSGYGGNNFAWVCRHRIRSPRSVARSHLSTHTHRLQSGSLRSRSSPAMWLCYRGLRGARYRIRQARAPCPVRAIRSETARPLSESPSCEHREPSSPGLFFVFLNAGVPTAWDSLEVEMHSGRRAHLDS